MIIQKKEKPSKKRDATLLTLKLYLSTTLMCFTLAYGFYLIDHSQPKNTAQIHCFFPIFTFGMPIVMTIVTWVIFLYDTRYRVNDPYRFASTQSREFKIPDFNQKNVNEIIKNLGYTVLETKEDKKFFYVNAVRIRPKYIERFKEKKSPSVHKILIIGHIASTGWNVIIECKPINRLALADFRNTIFDSLEELTNELGWRDFTSQED